MDFLEFEELLNLANWSTYLKCEKRFVTKMIVLWLLTVYGIHANFGIVNFVAISICKKLEWGMGSSCKT